MASQRPKNASGLSSERSPGDRTWAGGESESGKVTAANNQLGYDNLGIQHKNANVAARLIPISDSAK